MMKQLQVYLFCAVFGIGTFLSPVLGQSPTQNSETSLVSTSSVKIEPVSSSSGFQTGVLNVFTDLPDADILVDGLQAGVESIVRLPLEVGEHYVQVRYGNDIVYAETVTILPNRSKTVVSDHFVDIITNTPSRGAILREAARIRESRGDLGLGFLLQPDPHPAISIKWMKWKHVGFQGLFSGELGDSKYKGLYGGRVIVTPHSKIYNDDILTGYVFSGVGRVYRDAGDVIEGHDYHEIGLGVEANISTVVNNWYENRQKRVVIYTRSDKKSNDESISDAFKLDTLILLRDITFIVLSNIGYAGFEINTSKVEGGRYTTAVSFGFHVYF